MNKIYSLALLLCFILCATPANAQKSYPMLMSLKPVAAQVGQTSEHTISSRYSMYGAYQVLVSGEGVTGEILHPEVKEADKAKPPNLQTMKVRFTVAAEATPGVRDFRIATPNGVSTLGQLVISRDKVVVETDKNNNTAENAEPILLPAAVCGAVEKAEDVDYYKFNAAAGASLNFHVRSMRLQNKIHDLQQHIDPIITLRSAQGATLAASDNYFYGDPFLSHTFAAAGEYLLEIRDVRFQGNKYWEYCIEISNQPFVTTVYPLAVAAGKETKLQMIGFQIPADPMTTINPPADAAADAQCLPLPMGEAASNPVSVVVSKLPILQESDADNNTPEHAQTISLPGGVNGRIESAGDIDCFAFAAKKGEKFSFEVVARREQSALDSHLRILNSKGKQLALNDDMRIGKRSSADSQLENWKAPADGTYFIEVRDLHLRGGPAFVYFVRVTRSEPYFELYLDTDKTELTPGTGGVIYVRMVRKNGFAGEVQLKIEGLPAGVSATAGRILAGKGQDGCIVLSCEDAAMSVANITVSGKSVLPAEGEATPKELAAIAAIYQETYLPGGGRGHWPVGMHTVSVGRPSDILGVGLSAYEVSLKPGESKKIDVTIERA